MTLKLNPQAPRILLATALCIGAAAVQAASGFTVTPAQETLVTPGMDTAAVRQVLGQPTSSHTYANEPGPTWTYRASGNRDTEFDIDFGADGKVISATESVDESNGGPGGD